MQPASTETCNNTSSEATTGRLFLARNDKLDADIAAALLKGEGQGKTGPLAYLFSVAITAEDWTAAHAVGAARTAIAKARGRTSKKYRRPNDEDLDAAGALAELAMFDTFGRVADYCAPLLEYKPNRQGLDLGVGGEHYDVKAIPQSKTRCCINRAQHFEKRPRGYICVRIVSERILDVYYVAATDVEAWRVFTGYTPYFAANLPPAIPLPLTEDEPAC